MTHVLEQAGLHWSPQHIEEFERRCRDELPDGESYQSKWVLDFAYPEGERHAYFCVRNGQDGDKTVNFMLGFRRYRDRGGLVINAGYYQLGETHQNDVDRRYGSNMARFVFRYAREIEAERVTVCANLDIGSYAWARKFARPRHAEDIKAELRHRSRQLLTTGHWTEAEFAAVNKILETDDPDFLAKIAGLRRILSSFEPDLPKSHPGFQILSAYPLGELTWDGYWNLRDPSHIKLIESALNET